MSGVVLPGAGGSKEDDYGEVMKVRECDVNQKMWTAAHGLQENLIQQPFSIFTIVFGKSQKEKGVKEKKKGAFEYI